MKYLPIETDLELRSRRGESGKIGLAILLWLLGVPGLIILLYLIFA